MAAIKLGRIDYDLSWARVVSDILSPPVVWAALAFPIAWRDSASFWQGALWAVGYVALVCLVPILYIAIMVRRGTITDMHMKVRRQRLIPLFISMVCTGLAFVFLSLMDAPPVLPLFALISFIQLGVMLLITLMWQISMHAISISGATVATGAVFGATTGFLTLPLILLVAAARLKLRRHTPMQVLAGTAVGIVIPVLLLMVVTVPA